MRHGLLTVAIAALWLSSVGAEPQILVQEALLRAKPAVAIVVAEVGAEVAMNCGGRDIRVTPPPFRETGTGWFIDPNGRMVTNAHVVSPAYQPPQWLENQLDERRAAAGGEPG